MQKSEIFRKVMEGTDYDQGTIENVIGLFDEYQDVIKVRERIYDDFLAEIACTIWDNDVHDAGNIIDFQISTLRQISMNLYNVTP